MSGDNGGGTLLPRPVTPRYLQEPGEDLPLPLGRLLLGQRLALQQQELVLRRHGGCCPGAALPGHGGCARAHGVRREVQAPPISSPLGSPLTPPTLWGPSRPSLRPLPSADPGTERAPQHPPASRRSPSNRHFRLGRVQGLAPAAGQTGRPLAWRSGSRPNPASPPLVCEPGVAAVIGYRTPPWAGLGGGSLYKGAAAAGDRKSVV